jgi:hypothetical protein
MIFSGRTKGWTVLPAKLKVREMYPWPQAGTFVGSERVNVSYRAEMLYTAQ